MGLDCLKQERAHRDRACLIPGLFVLNVPATSPRRLNERTH